MGFIYKIWNDNNNKLYIGQTRVGITARWSQHLKNYLTNDAVIYRAMRKYGAGSFHIEQIEECADELLDEREIYWISFYNSKNNGYNSTIGGTALPSGNKPKLINDKLVKQLWDEGYSLIEIHQKTGNSTNSIREHLLDYINYSVEESIQRGLKKSAESRSTPVNQWDKQGNFIQTFNSAKQAANNTNIPNANICSVLNGKRQTAGGYYWTFENQLPTIKKQTKIYQYDLQGNLLNSFSTKAEAGRATHCNAADIGRVCKGQRQTCGGYIWKEE